MTVPWTGVIPALTTPFHPDLSVDHDFLARHCTWLVENGCSGIVALGSLGEGQTLRLREKGDIVATCVEAVGKQVPIIAGVSALSTADAIEIAETAADRGCHGLMILPPYVYVGDWRETKAHVAAVLRATELPCMLYNNPVAYHVDFTPPQVRELLGEHENLKAIKESSADVRRVAALRSIVEPSRLQILVGVDDMIVEALSIGAVGWIAGLVNAFPLESVALFQLALANEREQAFELYRWFLPLLRMDTVPKFVQLIKLAQQEVGMGATDVRPPRLELTGSEKTDALAIIRHALETRPEVMERAASQHVG